MRTLFTLCLIALAKPAEAEAPLTFIPKAVVLTEPTEAETRAHAAWSLRAALNVAALQCQYSPFLATVRNYNDILRHHGDELGQTIKTMTGHFRRVRGASLAQRSFDQYTTRTYNSFSTLEAQRAFCIVAGEVGRLALTSRKGSFSDGATLHLTQIRRAFLPVEANDPLRLIDRTSRQTPSLAMLCAGLSKRDKKGRCS